MTWEKLRGTQKVNESQIRYLCRQEKRYKCGKESGDCNLEKKLLQRSLCFSRPLRVCIVTRTGYHPIHHKNLITASCFIPGWLLLSFKVHSCQFSVDIHECFSPRGSPNKSLDFVAVNGPFRHPSKSTRRSRYDMKTAFVLACRLL